MSLYLLLVNWSISDDKDCFLLLVKSSVLYYHCLDETVKFQSNHRKCPAWKLPSKLELNHSNSTCLCFQLLFYCAVKDVRSLYHFLSLHLFLYQAFSFSLFPFLLTHMHTETAVTFIAFDRPPKSCLSIPRRFVVNHKVTNIGMSLYNSYTLISGLASEVGELTKHSR